MTKDLYDAAREACHSCGIPWTDPRTGVTYPPPATSDHFVILEAATHKLSQLIFEAEMADPRDGLDTVLELQDAYEELYSACKAFVERENK